MKTKSKRSQLPEACALGSSKERSAVMAREKPAYRDNLEFLLERSAGKAMLNYKEVGQLLGIDWRTAKKLFPFNSCNMISVPTLARELS